MDTIGPVGSVATAIPRAPRGGGPGSALSGRSVVRAGPVRPTPHRTDRPSAPILLRADPQDGGILDGDRTELILWFAEPVDPEQSTYVLGKADGTPVDVAVQPPGCDGGRLVVLVIPPLPLGTFVLDWRAVGVEDDAATSGSVVFGVGGRPAGVVSSTTGLPKGPRLFLRWLELSTLLLLVAPAVGMPGRFGAQRRQKS